MHDTVLIILFHYYEAFYLYSSWKYFTTRAQVFIPRNYGMQIIFIKKTEMKYYYGKNHQFKTFKLISVFLLVFWGLSKKLFDKFDKFDKFVKLVENWKQTFCRWHLESAFGAIRKLLRLQAISNLKSNFSPKHRNLL